MSGGINGRHSSTAADHRSNKILLQLIAAPTWTIWMHQKFLKLSKSSVTSHQSEISKGGVWLGNLLLLQRISFLSPHPGVHWNCHRSGSENARPVRTAYDTEDGRLL